jgi:hypothetical protein
MIPVLFLVGGAAALLWWLLGDKPGAMFALWAKRYDDGWEVYILSSYAKGRDEDEDASLTSLFSGSDLDKKPAEKAQNFTSYHRWEYVAVDKLSEKVYQGFLASRFDVLNEESVCDVIKEILTLPDTAYKGKGATLFVDAARYITLRRFAHPYISLESLGHVRSKVKKWL